MKNRQSKNRVRALSFVSTPRTVSDNLDEQTTVKNRSFSKSLKQSVRLLNNTKKLSLAVSRFQVNLRKISGDPKLIEAGLGFLLAIAGKITKKKKRLAMQALRDIIFQRVKVLAFLSFINDFFRQKRKENFVNFVEALKSANPRDSKESAVFSFKSESNKTPKFRNSKETLRHCECKPQIEEGLYRLSDLALNKTKKKALSYIQGYKYHFDVNSNRYTRVSIQPNSLQNSYFNKKNRNSKMSIRNFALLCDMIRVQLHNRLSKYFHVFKFKVLNAKIRRTPAYKPQTGFKQETIHQTKLLHFLCNSIMHNHFKFVFEKISVLTNKKSSIAESKVVYGKIKEIRRHFPPVKIATPGNQNQSVRKTSKVGTNGSVNFSLKLMTGGRTSIGVSRSKLMSYERFNTWGI